MDLKKKKKKISKVFQNYPKGKQITRMFKVPYNLNKVKPVGQIQNGSQIL